VGLKNFWKGASVPELPTFMPMLFHLFILYCISITLETLRLRVAQIWYAPCSWLNLEQICSRLDPNEIKELLWQAVMCAAQLELLLSQHLWIWSGNWECVEQIWTPDDQWHFSGPSMSKINI